MSLQDFDVSLMYEDLAQLEVKLMALIEQQKQEKEAAEAATAIAVVTTNTTNEAAAKQQDTRPLVVVEATSSQDA